MTSLPLEGIVVVSLEQAVAAPFATRQLADLGARVIKVERDSGDFARAYDRSVDGEASYFVWLNRTKESVVLNLKDADDLALLERVIAEADVFVQNLAPGAVERLGLGGAELTARHPRLIHVSISGYGVGGPMSQKKAYDLLIQCESGMLSVTGTPETPTKVGVSIADVAAGMYAYTGVLTALINRGRTGRGDVIEISMLEALGEWMAQPELYARYSGVQPPRTGASHPTIAPYGPFATADGTVFLSVQNEREWSAFCTDVLRDASVADRADFADNTARVAHRSALDAHIGSAFAAMTSAEAIARLEAAGIANARLRTLAEVADHPQLAARERWRDVVTPSGVARVQRPPVTSREQHTAWAAVPAVGEHTARVRAEFTAHSRP